MNLMGMTAVELGKAIKDGQVSVVEATQAVLTASRRARKITIVLSRLIVKEHLPRLRKCRRR